MKQLLKKTLLFENVPCYTPHSIQAHTTWGEGVRSQQPFFKIEIKRPDFGKNALIILINGLNISFKMLF